MSKLEIPEMIHTWRMRVSKQNSKQRKIESCFIPTPEIGKRDVLVKIAGCGVCGTDISLFSGEVQPISRLPLTLGHEISGEVIGGDVQWVGKKVIIPTILPCNQCELCNNGRSNRCLSQKMLGYSFGPYGGFSSHVVVPGGDLCEVPENNEFDLADLAVVADAVATPFQAAKKANLHQGDKVVIIGPTGGLGIYMTQWARVLGASIIIGIGRDKDKLNIAEKYGLDLSLSTKDKTAFELLCDLTGFCRKNHIKNRSCWKIFEMTGSSEGQRLGLELLSYASTLVVVGYGFHDLSYNFSKLMAYDSEIVGSWGCEPRHYPEILKHVLEGRINVRPFVEKRPLGTITETFREIHCGRKSIKRIVLTPEA